jgi:alanine racemase
VSAPPAARAPIERRLAEAGLPPLTRLSWLEIDVDALAHNLRVTRDAAGGQAEVAAVVKADAYGHGAEASARAFVDAGAQRLCVATFDEALLLRDAGISVPILVLFRVPADAVESAAQQGIELVVADEPGATELLARWNEARRRLPDATPLTLQVEVDTGLGRAGLKPERVADFVAGLSSTPGVRLAGLWTHLASPGDPQSAQAQVDEFERASARLREAGLPLPPRHAAATGGIFTGSTPPYDAIRPGLCLYGLLPDDLAVPDHQKQAATSLRPALALKARPLRVESVPIGAGVSYGSRWRADRPSTIATLAVGYSDGWPRLSSPGGEVLVNGRRAPLVGTVAMDAVMLDVTDVAGVDEGSEFTFIGRDGESEITAAEVARARNTISWEVVATLAQRIPRVYHAGPVLVGRRTLTGQTVDGVAR